jgi:hypothetical protein
MERLDEKEEKAQIVVHARMWLNRPLTEHSTATQRCIHIPLVTLRGGNSPHS